MARLPAAPTRSAVQLRGDYAQAGPDFRVAQHYEGYTADEQAIWRTLYERQLGLMSEDAAPDVVAGRRLLGAEGTRIAVLADARERLNRLTGVGGVSVPLVFDGAGFLVASAERRFPVTVW